MPPFSDYPFSTDFPLAEPNAEPAGVRPAGPLQPGGSDTPSGQLAQRDMALNNMAHGLSLYSGAGRLLFCNDRYRDIYGLSAADTAPGGTLIEQLQLRQRNGTFKGDPERFVAGIIDGIKAGKTVERVTELPDGRIFIVTNTPTPDGGWVATHCDVTAGVHAERELARTKNFLDTVINHVPAVIFVKDARTLKYVLINKRGEDYLGLGSEQVIGKTAHDLFDSERAERITTTDRKVLANIATDDYIGAPLHNADMRQLVITTKREVVCDSDGKPEYLITIIEDVTEQTRAAERVAHMARHDSLTGLGNRMQFAERVNDALQDLDHGGRNFNVLLIDLDHFKNVNDSLGHPIGDALLKVAAKRLMGLLTPDDAIVRLSGDEFAIMQVVDGDQREAAVALANRIRETISEPIEIDGHQLIIGTSIGIAFAPDHGRDNDELAKCADLALYRAKFSGRNQHCFFESVMEKEVHVRRTLELDLRRALAQQQFELRYQPVVNSLTRETCGVEALVRWNSPEKGLILPDRFIPLAEETGLIVPLGEWVLRRACADAIEWPAAIKVAVNLSAVQFNKGDLVGLVSGALVETGLAPERLELEITESVLLHKNEDNIALLHALKNLGVAIVLDDFGTGYSSLSYLKMFPFDKIKIDKSFVNELSTRMDCAAIVCAIAGLGRSLNIATTAEGVETQEQFTLLRAVGCSLMQGYLFGKPVPKTELDFVTPVASRRAAPFLAEAAVNGVGNGVGLPRQIV